MYVDTISETVKLFSSLMSNCQHINCTLSMYTEFDHTVGLTVMWVGKYCGFSCSVCVTVLCSCQY